MKKSLYFKLGHFGKLEDQFKVFYLLLSAKSCPTATLLSIFNSTGNERVASVLQHEEMASSDSNEETVEENEQWILLQKVITSNIDRLSSHTMNLGLVLCFASGIGLITGKDREIIVCLFISKLLSKFLRRISNCFVSMITLIEFVCSFSGKLFHLGNRSAKEILPYCE